MIYKNKKKNNGLIFKNKNIKNLEMEYKKKAQKINIMNRVKMRLLILFKEILILRQMIFPKLYLFKIKIIQNKKWVNK